MDEVISAILVYGTLWGATYSLLALGLTLIYGVGKIVNLAHGAFIMLSAYFFYYFLVLGGVNYVASFLLAILCVIALAVLMYVLAIHPIRQSEMSVLTITFGLGLVFQYVILLTFGPLSKSVPYIFSGTMTFLGTTVETQFASVIIAFVISCALLSLFLSRFKVGKAVRAVAQDGEAAEAFGISTFRIYILTMGIAAALAGVASVLVAPTYALFPGMGWEPMVTVFAILIFGGLGSIKGTILASFILGYTRNAVSLVFSPAYGPVVALVVLIAVILVRPSGIFGRGV